LEEKSTYLYQLSLKKKQSFLISSIFEEMIDSIVKRFLVGQKKRIFSLKFLKKNFFEKKKPKISRKTLKKIYQSSALISLNIFDPKGLSCENF